jgi:hypothetical protein
MPGVGAGDRKCNHIDQYRGCEGREKRGAFVVEDCP